MMIKLRPAQCTVFNSLARFRALVAGRRFGKTYLSQVELCRAAFKPGRLAWYVAPTYKQAKRVVWKPLKQLTRPYWACQPNETDLRIEIKGGGTICLRGADNYDSLRGEGLDFLVLDEYASIGKEAWQEVLRPSLADRQGKALFIGTPRGYNHFYDLYQEALNQPDWETFQFTTEQGGNVTKEEILSATHDLDERTFRQEFQATFENLGSGLVYFAFDRLKDVGPVRFNPKLPLFWSLDFNVNPMCSVIGQREGDRINVLAEVALPDSNTRAACAAFMDRIAQLGQVSPHLTRIQIYGDATGRGRQTAASRTDWQIVQDFFKLYPYNVNFKVPSSNPPVRDRTNCVNAMLCNQAGERRLRIHPDCKQLIQDLERVRWGSDANGNTLAVIDKSDTARSHSSDALGYMIANDFGMRPFVGEMPGLVW